MKKQRNRFSYNKQRFAFGTNAKTSRGRQGYVCFEQLEPRALLAGDTTISMRDLLNRADVNHDGRISGLDALMIINDLNAQGGAHSVARSILNSASIVPASSSLSTQSAAALDVNNDGLVSAFDANLVINALAAAPAVGVTLTALDKNTLLPITTITAGNDFLLEADVQDLRTGPRDNTESSNAFGVFASYLDVTYDPTKASVNGPLSFPGGFTSTEKPHPPNPATTVQGTITDAGAINPSLSPIVTSPPAPVQKLWIATVHANAAGTETFQASHTTVVGDDTLLYGSNHKFTQDEMLFTNATITIMPATGNPIVSINSISNNEGNSGTTPFVFTATLSFAAASPVTVHYATADGTATLADSDYVAQSGTLTFATGATTQTITIQVNGDTTVEPDEIFSVNLDSPSGAALGTAQGFGTIKNDDNGAAISIGSTQQNEGNAGTTAFVFAVSLATASQSQVTVQYATSDGTATVADNDYVAQTGTVTFAAGEVSKSITINVNGDTKPEANETFNVNLSNPTNATISVATATGTILNDDGTAISIGDVSLNEGNSGTTPFVFTVNLSAPSTQQVKVAFATADGTATIADNDYASQAGTLTFAAGTTSQTITVNVTGDTKFEGDETFTVNLSSPTNATLANTKGTGTILNDDAATSTLSIGNVTQNEGNTGVTNFVFTVTLSPSSGLPVTVAYTTADGSATVSDNDYLAQSGTLTFAAGTTTQTITISVNGDTKVEPNETFVVNLSNPTNATLGTSPQGTGTIVNDDGATLSINNVSLNEGNSGTTPFVFNVQLSATSTDTVTVAYSTADGSATTADSDYTAQTGTLTFTPGTTSQLITIAVNGDTKFEPNETFTVNLANPTNATLTSTVGTGTILNDDVAPTLSINNISQNEGNAGTTPFVFTVTLSAAQTQPVTVAYSTADGSATTANNDYQAQSGTLTFAAGATSQTITIAVNGDTTVEPDETFSVNLSSPTNATVAVSQGVGTIVNDDTGLSVSNVSQNEGNSGTTPFVFTVSLGAAANQQVTVNYATADGTATVADNDYVAQSGTLTFATGTTSQTITIAVNGDTKIEPNETFTVNLSNASGAAIVGAQGTGTIVNDDGTATSSVAGFVYADVNNNGIFDVGVEQGIKDVNLTLTGPGGTVPAMTDSNGFYHFTNLAAGQYTITEQQPAGFMDGSITVDTVNLQNTSTGTNQLTFTISAGTTSTGNNFGERGLSPGDVSKRQFLNTSNDGATSAAASSNSSSFQSSSVRSQSTISPSAADLALSQMKSFFLV